MVKQQRDHRGRVFIRPFLHFACPSFRSMMIRGESFRSDYRVPTHMVHCMTNAQSIDRLVQSTGRATFLGKDFLARNGFNCVQARRGTCRVSSLLAAAYLPSSASRGGCGVIEGLFWRRRKVTISPAPIAADRQVLMTDVDFRTVKAYIKLSNTIKERLQLGKTLSQCFSGAARPCVIPSPPSTRSPANPPAN